MTGAPDNVPRVPGGRVMAGSTRRLSAIMFTDVVGYSAQVQKNEALALELLDIHRRNLRRQLPGFGGREVETAGDGFLIEFSSALEALRCAIAIQKEQAARNAGAPSERQLRLRIGIHLGDVEHRHKSLFGDGVNLAARLEPLSPPGGIALSAQIHDQVKLVFPVGYRSLGPQNLKNIAAPLEVFVLDAATLDGLAVPEPRRNRSLLAHRSPWMARTGVVASVLVLAVAVFFSTKTTPVEASVAVLPFTNLSEDPATNEYLAGGIHESVLTHLAQVRDLKVISRTSVMEYESSRRNLREIGKALGVANILEGSIQRVGNRVRVTAQLIEVATDRHLWAEAYDRDISDLFAIQSDVAAQVAGAVEAQLTPEIRTEFATRPTGSNEAYDLYLRALDYDRRNGMSRDNLSRMQPLLESALALDPGFAVAHALLARTHLRVYFFAIDPSPARLEASRSSAEAALRIHPGLMEGHLVLGAYYAYGTRDYPKAMSQFELALQARPNSAEVYRGIGNLQRTLGRWDEAGHSLAKALELDPRNLTELRNLATLYQGLRRYPEAAELYKRAAALAPDDVFIRLQQGWLAIVAEGDLEPMRRVLREVPRGQDPDNMISYARYELAMLEGDYAKAWTLLQNYPSDWLPATGGTGREPKELAAAAVKDLLGEPAAARTLYARAKALLLAGMRDETGTPGEQAALAVAQAGLGETGAALATIRLALHNSEESGDAFARTLISADVAQVYLAAGQNEQAMAELERSLSTPFGLSRNELGLLPEFRRLRGMPAFEKLLRETRQKD